MTNRAEMSAFVQEGISRYAGARDAVELFEQQIHAQLRHALEDCRWRNFAAAERTASRAINTGVGRGDTRAIWASHYGRNEGDGSIALGVWWYPPRETEKVVVYCARWSAESRLVPITLADPEFPIQAGSLNEAGSRLYAPLTADTNLDDVARRLLVETDRALGVAASSAEGGAK